MNFQNSDLLGTTLKTQRLSQIQKDEKLGNFESVNAVV